MKVQKNKIDYFLQICTFLMILIVTVYIVLIWQHIPQTILVHYNSYGIIDRYGNKNELLILLVVSWVLYLGMLGVSFFPRIWNIPVSTQGKNKEKIYHITLYLVETMNFIITCVFCFLSLYTLTGQNLPSFFILYVPMILIIILCFGIWMWKVK